MNLLEHFRKTEAGRMRVLVCGNPILRRKSDPVGEVTPDIRELARRMVITMYENEIRGIGLAAPQVGVNLRMIVVDTRDDEPPGPDASPGELLLEPRMPLVLINPEVVSSSAETEAVSEGCLSIPELGADVVRPVRIVLRAQTLDGALIETECGGLLARCLQHEIDHLDGILFVDRISEEDKRELEPELKALEKRERRYMKKNRAS